MVHATPGLPNPSRKVHARSINNGAELPNLLSTQTKERIPTPALNQIFIDELMKFSRLEKEVGVRRIYFISIIPSVEEGRKPLQGDQRLLYAIHRRRVCSKNDRTCTVKQRFGLVSRTRYLQHQRLRNHLQRAPIHCYL